jgi:surfactin synthase thioesterase subunit
MSASSRGTRLTAGLTGTPGAQHRTFVLIPGAGGAAWYWHRIAPLLRAAGHEAIAVDLPGDDLAAGLPQYADLVTSAIGNRGSLVLVAMSLGGFTAPLVAAKVPVDALVFVNAMIPAPGETPGAWWDNTGWAEARVAAAERGGYSAEFDLGVYFLHDVPPEVAAAGEPYQRPEADAVFGSACDFSAWPPVPIRAVAGADDRFFPVGFQQALARDRLGIEADVLPGGHLIALSQPARLARYLLGV